MSYIYPNSRFANAQNAFVMLFDAVNRQGHEIGNGTKALYNVGFYIENPVENTIDVAWRKWNEKYAEREWKWYLSKNRSVEELKKFAPIWDTMHNGDNIVNSNYGFLWNEEDQLKKTIEQLKKDDKTRQAWITIFDGKNKDEFEKDTPCTLDIGFMVMDGKLCMNVLMRSNDLWFGFCNDQYCFSNLQQIVAKELGLEVGWYYHYAANLHIYEKHYDADFNFYQGNTDHEHDYKKDGKRMQKCTICGDLKPIDKKAKK